MFRLSWTRPPLRGKVRQRVRKSYQSKKERDLMAGRGQSVLFCQTRNRGRRLAYDSELDLYQCPGRGKDCRFAEQPDGSLERFGSDCGRLPQSNRGS